MKETRISASRTQDFINCPLIYYYAVELGLTPEVDTDTQRVGTNWHKIHELVGAERDYDTAVQIAVDYLEDYYSQVPDVKTTEEWDTERNILLYSYIGHFLRYYDDPVEVLATEFKFNLPMRHPETGRALPNVRRTGIIDRLIRYHGQVYVWDFKSSSKSVDAEGSFWDNLRLAIQPSLYYDAALELQQTGQLGVFGIKADDPPIHGILFDAWHKPGIKPKSLSQKDTKEFEETKKYCEMEFDVVHTMADSQAIEVGISVDDEVTEIIPGKKEGTYAIKETPRMYGARLLQDINERPDFYFSRQPIPRTAADMVRFRRQLYSVYKNILSLRRSGYWYGDPSHCEATYKCSYCPICYGYADISDGQIPPGFKIKGSK